MPLRLLHLKSVSLRQQPSHQTDTRRTARLSSANRGDTIRVATSAVDSKPRQCVLLDRSHELVLYQEAWELQRQCLQQLRKFAEDGVEGHDYLIMLQHHPVFTLGAGSTESHLKFDISAPPLPLHRVERGGEVTYHGPGQLVMYPIIDLNYHQKDLHWYMRSLEEVVIRALDQVSGLTGQRIEGLTGVWIDGSKVAAIGVRAQRWITYHGVALNLDMNLDPWKYIVPCGISDRPVSTVARLLRSDEGGGGDGVNEIIKEYRFALLEGYADVFGSEFVSMPASDCVDST